MKDYSTSFFFFFLILFVKTKHQQLRHHNLFKISTGIRLCRKFEELLFMHLVDFSQLVIFLDDDLFESLDLNPKTK